MKRNETDANVKCNTGAIVVIFFFAIPIVSAVLIGIFTDDAPDDSMENTIPVDPLISNATWECTEWNDMITEQIAEPELDNLCFIKYCNKYETVCYDDCCKKYYGDNYGNYGNDFSKCLRTWACEASCSSSYQTCRAEDIEMVRSGCIIPTHIINVTKHNCVKEHLIRIPEANDEGY